MKRVTVYFLSLLLLGLLLIACQLTPFVATPTPQAVQPSPIPSVVKPTLPAARPSPMRGNCGDGRCDGPENPRNCPADCGATAAATIVGGSAGSWEYAVTNPASNASLAVYVNTPLPPRLLLR